METVGYQLFDSTGKIIQQWGGTPGQCPAVPDFIKLPAPEGEIQIHNMQLNHDFHGFILKEWKMKAK